MTDFQTVAREANLVAATVMAVLAAVAVVAGSIWYGYELRTRLALKLEHFRISQRAWTDYKERDRDQARGEIHDITERQSGR